MTKRVLMTIAAALLALGATAAGTYPAARSVCGDLSSTRQPNRSSDANLFSPRFEPLLPRPSYSQPGSRIAARTLAAPAGSQRQATDLFISEYIEGSSYNKAIEIFNGTGNPVDLTNYKLELYSNGASSPSNFVILSGTLANGDVLVLAHPSANASILSVADLTSSSVINFNGDDAVALVKISTGAYVDIFGRIGNDPGEAWVADGGFSTKDKTLVRIPSVTGGVTQNPTGTGASAFGTLGTQWNQYPVDSSDNLGSHTFDWGGGEIIAPTMQCSDIIAYPANEEVALEWTPGNGYRRIVKINTTNSFTAPSDGSDPIANPVYSGSGEQVIFNGGTQIIEGLPFNGCQVSGLQTLTTYWIRAFEFNGSGTETRFLTSTAAANPVSATTTNYDDTGYYTGISGYGASLKANLHNLLRTTHSTQYSYDALWIQLPYTDEDPNNSNNIIEIYTGWSVPKTHYGGGVTEWNREHTWSKSHGDFGDTRPAGTDLHHLRPCDSTVNSSKSNRDFDMGSSSYYDASPYGSYSSDTGCLTASNIWEPRDEDKGDVARMIMYMAVRYEGTDTSYNLEIVDYTDTAPNYEPLYGKLSTLLAWHVQDPPDDRERQRNDRIHERQGNRNPFIDNSLYAHQIWSPVPIGPSNVTQTSFTANWSTPISASSYYLQVATDSLFTVFVPGYSNYNANLSTSKPITGLSSGLTYYYRLRSYFLSGYSMFSPWMAVNLVQPSGTASLTALASVFEYDLDGAALQLNINGTVFADAWLALANFSLQNAPTGLSIQSISYINSTTAQLILGFDGSDFDDNHLISILIDQAEINQSTSITSSILQLTAYVETLLSIDQSQASIILNLNPVAGASSYRVFGANDPFGPFQDISSQGSFDPAIPSRWSLAPILQPRAFFRAAAIRN